MKLRHALIAVLGALVVIVCYARESILFKLGSFLMVDQPASKVDAAIVLGSITPKVAKCYQKGDCPRIYVLMENVTDTWKVLRKIDFEDIVRKQARDRGIKETDLVFLKPRLIGAFQSAEFLKNLFQKNNIRSAVFFLPYYKTRNQRFYLDRYVTQPGLSLYVQPLDNQDSTAFDRWWENTMLDNLFADEYMEILFYYVNKLLWSPVV